MSAFYLHYVVGEPYRAVSDCDDKAHESGGGVSAQQERERERGGDEKSHAAHSGRAALRLVALHIPEYGLSRPVLAENGYDKRHERGAKRE